MWRVFIVLIWFTTNDQQFIKADSMFENFSIHAIIDYERELLSKNLTIIKIDNDDIIQHWQDWVLANIIAVNYLNSLMVLASRGDFAFSIPSGYVVKYIENPTSFQRTVTQLGTQMRSALTNAREDLNRVYTGMERVPDHLKTMILLLKHAPSELLVMLFPDSFNDIEKLVNDSLVVLRRPHKEFEQVLNLVTEVDHLLSGQSIDSMISLQVLDIKTEWSHLTSLVTALSQRAERTRESFLLQFNWILQQFIRPDIPISDSNRNFTLMILLPKTVEIDQTCDLLGVVTKTYTDISYQYTDSEVNSYGHLLTLSKEEDRKRYLKQFQYDLITKVVPSTRLALQRHVEFLQRDSIRLENFEKFLADTSPTDLINLIG